MDDHPRPLVAVGHVEPVPRRIRAALAGQVVLDTVRALYVWETPFYPQYHVPLGDVRPGVLVDEDVIEQLPSGPARRHGLRVGGTHRPASAHVFGEVASQIRCKSRGTEAPGW